MNKALALWREPGGHIKSIQQLLEDCGNTSKPGLHKVKKGQKDMNIELCKKKLGEGTYTAAIRILTSNGIAPNNASTLEDLVLKHPYALPPCIPDVPLEVDPAYADKDVILSRIKSFPRGTACGRDGLHAQHFIDALSGPGGAVADELLASITSIVNILLAGLCPPQLGEFIASAPLTPLLKPDGSIRPIAVGTIWRRIVSKVAAILVSKDTTKYLANYQFGVGVSGGGEAILHSVNRVIEDKGADGSYSMLLVDFKNAFNLVDRSAMLREVRNHCPSISKWVEFCYATPARLYYDSHSLASSTGVQQGDPLGPLLFALTLHPIALQVAKECTLDLQAWYLDDGTLIGDTLMVSRALEIIRKEGSARGLELNVHKTEIFWPTVDVRSNQDGVFPFGIGRPTNGVKLLGAPVSLDKQFCSQFIVNRVYKTIKLMEAVHSLDDPQCELLLLRNCTGVSRLYFSMRTTSPLHVKEAQVIFDKYLDSYLRNLIVGDGPGYGPLQYRFATLPICEGGLGIYCMQDTMHYCYLASCLQTTLLQGSILAASDVMVRGPSFHIALDLFLQVSKLNSSLNVDESAPHSMSSLAVKYFSAVIKDLPTTFDLSKRDLVLWQCNKVPHAQDYLLAIPADGLGQVMGPRHFNSVLCYRLGIPMFAENSLCSCCGKCMDIYGDHALHCASEVGLKFRHDFVRDTFADICFRAGIPFKLEADLGFLAEDGRNSRPADLLVYNWESGRDTCFDVTIVSPFSGSGFSSFTPGRALSKAIEQKRNKYLDICSANRYNFGTLGFTTFGEFGDESSEFLRRMKTYMARHNISTNVGNFLCIRIGFAIQRGIGTQLVARLPSDSVLD